MKNSFLLLLMISTVVGYAEQTHQQHQQHQHQQHQHDQHQHGLHQQASDDTTGEKILDCHTVVIAEVNGLVCDFCARAIEKVFKKRKEVANISVDLSQGKITIWLNGVIKDDALTKMINDSGYALVEIKRQKCNLVED